MAVTHTLMYVQHHVVQFLVMVKVGIITLVKVKMIGHYTRRLHFCLPSAHVNTTIFHFLSCVRT